VNGDGIIMQPMLEVVEVSRLKTETSFYSYLPKARCGCQPFSNNVVGSTPNDMAFKMNSG
jgi:hypothetical protein